MANKLKNLVITKVALVDDGSCSAAHIKLYKRKEGGRVMNFEEFLKSLPEDQRKLVEAEMAKAQATLPEGAATAEEKKSLEDKLTQAGVEKAAAETAKIAAEAEVAKLKQPDAQTEEELLKSLDPAVRAMIEKSNAKVAAAEAVVKKLKDDTDTAEALAKAKELVNLSGKEEDLAKVFKTLKNSDEATFNTVFEVLKSANELIKTSAAFTETGSNRANETELAKAADAAWAELEKKADDIKKANPSLSKEAAIAKATKENPDIYKRYMDSLV